MGKKRHPTILPSLEAALERVKEQHQVGLRGLEGPPVTPEDPEFDDAHTVSHTHPFTPDREDEK